MVQTVSTAMAGYSDIHMTQPQVAKRIIEHFKPAGKCLEPFFGDGAFFQHLPEGADWCELSKGKDFFAYHQKVDWIVTNPPFSNLTEVFRHAFHIARNSVFLIPISKFWSSQPRIALAREYAGLAEIAHVGTGRNIGFDIGFPFAAMHFKRGYVGPIIQNTILIDDYSTADGSFSSHQKEFANESFC